MSSHKKKQAEKFLINELYRKYKALDKEVNELKIKMSIPNISVEKLYIHELKDLIFRMDALDIKDLSGTLNIGNNFPPKDKKEKSDSSEKEESKGKHKKKQHKHHKHKHEH